jgi:hypothetical protein
MNFSTRKMQNNKMLFVYTNGQTRETEFTEVEYYGDSYVLAKEKGSLFYTLLDLNGNEGEKKVYVVYRFNNGKLLTYNAFAKRYVPSDGQHYVINYNVYKMYDADTRKSYTINVIQSDSLLSDREDVAKGYKLEKFNNVYINKQMYRFNELIFSEVIEDKFVLNAGLIASPGKNADGFDLNKYIERKVWSIADVTSHESFNGDNDITVSRKGITFNEAEEKLYAVVDNSCELKFNENYSDKDALAQSAYTSRARKSRWNNLLNRLIDFNEN